MNNNESFEGLLEDDIKIAERKYTIYNIAKEQYADNYTHDKEAFTRYLKESIAKLDNRLFWTREERDQNQIESQYVPKEEDIGLLEESINWILDRYTQRH